MSELFKIAQPIVQDVSVQEAQQGGVRTSQPLNDRKRGIAEAFVRAHESTHSTFTSAVPHPAASLAGRAASPLPPAVQVDSYEQALAVAAHGIYESKRTRDRSPHVMMYRARFTPDSNFLRKDLKVFKASLATRSKSLVDLATHLKPEEQALRRFLLLKMLDSDTGLTRLERATAHKLMNRCLAEHGDYINSAVAAFEVGSALRLDRPSLNEYIKAFHLIESKSGDLIQPDNMLLLFRHLRRGTTEDNLPGTLKNFKAELIGTLSREKTQRPSRASVVRQHLIISQIQQVRIMQKFLIVHQRFINCCKKLNFDNLPNPLDLMEMGLRAMASGEIIGGISDLVRCAGGVTAQQRPAKNIFMTNYAMGVLKNPEFSQLYRTRAHQLQVTEGIGKQMVAGAVLGAVRQHD